MPPQTAGASWLMKEQKKYQFKQHLNLSLYGIANNVNENFYLNYKVKDSV